MGETMQVDEKETSAPDEEKKVEQGWSMLEKQSCLGYGVNSALTKMALVPIQAKHT